METYYTLKEASEVVHIGVRTLREYVKDGKIKASKVGRSYLVGETELDRFIKSREGGKVEPLA